MADEVDLGLVSSEELIKELFHRYPRMVIVREKKAKIGDIDELVYDYEGGLTPAIGLVERAKAAFLEIAAINRTNRDLEQ